MEAWSYCSYVTVPLDSKDESRMRVFCLPPPMQTTSIHFALSHFTIECILHLPRLTHLPTHTQWRPSTQLLPLSILHNRLPDFIFITEFFHFCHNQELYDAEKA